MRRTSWRAPVRLPVCREPQRSAPRASGVRWGGQVKYASLPNFEEREEDFRAESVILRRRFTEEGPGLPRGAWCGLTCRGAGGWRRGLQHAPSLDQK